MGALGDLMSTRQRNDESIDDWALATENRLNVYTAIGGSVLAPGLITAMAKESYNKDYISLTMTEKTAVDKGTTERLMAMILFKNSCSERFGKLHKEIHDDHLKSLDKTVSKHQPSTAGVICLLNHHSKSERETQTKQRQKGTEVAFAQGDDESQQRGFGHRKGNSRICGIARHHAWECPDKGRNNNDDTNKEEKKESVSKLETRKVAVGTTLAAHGTYTGDEYNSEDECGHEENQSIMFMTVEISEVKVTSELMGTVDLLELEHTFGQSDSKSSPIPEDWCILDNQSTVNFFRNRKYLKNIRKVENHVVIKCNAGVRKTNWVGDLPGFPEPVWYDPGGIANIISMGQAEKYFFVEYSSRDNNGFVITHKEVDQ